jgi:hypothetical protein
MNSLLAGVVVPRCYATAPWTVSTEALRSSRELHIPLLTTSPPSPLQCIYAPLASSWRRRRRSTQ